MRALCFDAIPAWGLDGFQSSDLHAAIAMDKGGRQLVANRGEWHNDLASRPIGGCGDLERTAPFCVVFIDSSYYSVAKFHRYAYPILK